MSGTHSLIIGLASDWILTAILRTSIGISMPVKLCTQELGLHMDDARCINLEWTILKEV